MKALFRWAFPVSEIRHIKHTISIRFFIIRIIFGKSTKKIGFGGYLFLFSGIKGQRNNKIVTI